jgi:signal transduction histidine kinase
VLLETSVLDPRARQQVTRISRATEAMTQLVATFLLLARDKDNVTAQGNLVTLRATADELTEIWGKQIEAKGLEFIYRPDNAMTGLYNQTFLHSVMGNLLRNAWHYSDHGFVSLTLTPTGFTVEDSGIGIAPDQQEAMFEPFIRGPEKRGEGLGLGLSLVQRICTSQGWEVSLSTREPNGCRFTVQLLKV